MNTIAITATTPTTPDTFVQDALAGTVQFHTVRADGTQRRVRLLTGDELEAAEGIVEAKDEGATMRELAQQLHIAIPTVRRTINRYLLTEEVLTADEDELAEMVALANTGLDEQPTDDGEATDAEQGDDQAMPTVSPAPELEAALRASLAPASTDQGAQPQAA